MQTVALLVATLLVSIPSGSAQALLAGSEIDEHPWKAGVASRDITPDQPIWMAGYGARSTPSSGTQQRLWVKALALEDDGGDRAVIVTSDLLGIPGEMSERIRERLAQEFNLPRARVMLTSSHTHTGPVLENALYDIYPLGDAERQRIERYTRRVEDEVVAAVDAALTSLEPAQLSAGFGVVRFAVNRRNNRPASIRSQVELAGPTDHDVPVLAVRSVDGAVRALLFGYACHATTLPPDALEWSGDYPGYAQEALEDRFGGATALFFAGAGADQDPIPRGSVALARQYGHELAAAVVRVIEEGLTPVTGRISTAYSEIPLPLSDPPSRESLQAAIEEEGGYSRRWAERMLARLDRGEVPPSSYPYPVQVWKLGELPLVALGGEVVVDYSFAIKRMMGHNTFVVAYANDVMGYIPSVRVLREGGYEGERAQRVYGLPATWSPALEILIHTEIQRLASEAGIDLPPSELR